MRVERVAAFPSIVERFHQPARLFVVEVEEPRGEHPIKRFPEMEGLLCNPPDLNVLYVDFFRRGGFAIRNGRTAGEFKEFPFPLLIVLQSAQRRDNIAERLFNWNPPVFSQAWLTTMQEVTAYPLCPIWTRPADYREYFFGSSYQRRRDLMSSMP